MAKKKTAIRKTRHTTATAAEARNNGSKAASLAPSNASSPSPQPLDQVQPGRRKGLPRKSPSQNDTSKGIVFSFRFQKDPTLSMAVDIRSYDQQFDSESGEQATTEPTSTLATAADSEPTAATTNQKGTAAFCLTDLSHIDIDDPRPSSPSSSALLSLSSASSFPVGSAEAVLTSTELRLAGEKWSSDPTSYRSNNVFDQSRNLLILHTRKPAAAAAPLPTPPSSARTSIVPSPQDSTLTFHPYRRSMGSSSSTSSLHSTPALSQSGSTASPSSSSNSSSPKCSPSSPTPSFTTSSAMAPSAVQQKQQLQEHQRQSREDSCSVESLPALELTGTQRTRFLNVRGLGGTNGGRRMQVILVS